MKFMGMDMNSSTGEFTSKLQSLGYTIDRDLSDCRIFRGTFLSRECNIYISSAKISKKVYRISVNTIGQYSTDDLEKLYFNTVDEYKKKYGDCKSKPITQELRNNPLFDALFGGAIQLSSCKLPEGFIIIFMTKDMLGITYEDNINLAIHARERNDEI